MLRTTPLSYWQYLKGFEILHLKLQCKLNFLHFSSFLTHWCYHKCNYLLNFTLPTIQKTHEVLENGLKPCGDIFTSTSLIFSITCKQYLVVRADGTCYQICIRCSWFDISLLTSAFLWWLFPCEVRGTKRVSTNDPTTSCVICLACRDNTSSRR